MTWDAVSWSTMWNALLKREAGRLRYNSSVRLCIRRSMCSHISATRSSHALARDIHKRHTTAFYYTPLAAIVRTRPGRGDLSYLESTLHLRRWLTSNINPYNSRSGNHTTKSQSGRASVTTSLTSTSTTTTSLALAIARLEKEAAQTIQEISLTSLVLQNKATRLPAPRQFLPGRTLACIPQSSKHSSPKRRKALISGRRRCALLSRMPRNRRKDSMYSGPQSHILTS